MSSAKSNFFDIWNREKSKIGVQEVIAMDRFIPRKKMSKKARTLLDKQRRATWAFSPIIRKVESKKQYSRKRNDHADY